MDGCVGLYVDIDYWVDGYTVDIDGQNIPSNVFNPVTQILPAYLYQQYQPDDNVNAFFLAYNQIAQTNLDYLVNLNLPVWTSPQVNGWLLDWVAESLYGFKRPVLTYAAGELIKGMFNTFEFNDEAYNLPGFTVNSQTVAVNDDIFKRCLTWNLWKGEGFQFNARWLKNRVYRFLTDDNCYPMESTTYFIGVDFVSQTDITINVNTSFLPDDTIALVLQSAVTSQVLNLPFQYNFTVSL